DVDEVPAEGAGDVVVADVGTGLGAGGAGALVPQLPAARAEAGAVVGRGGDAEAFVLAAAGGGGRGLLLRGGRFGGEHGAGGRGGAGAGPFRGDEFPDGRGHLLAEPLDGLRVVGAEEEHAHPVVEGESGELLDP